MDLNYILIIFSFIFGSVVGSFLNVCIYRLPRDESIVYPSSRCTSCNYHIPFYLNIPILAYLYLGGRCYNCKTRIGIDYLIVEFLAGLFSVLLFIKFGLSIHLIFMFILVMSLIVVTFIDLEHMIIPNVITYPGILAGLLYNGLLTDFQITGALIDSFQLNFFFIIHLLDEIRIFNAIFGVILGGGSLLLIGFLYKRIRQIDGLGLGDVKLLAMIGAFLGWRSIIFVALVSSLLGTIIGLSIALYRKDDLKYAIPYGPFLAFAATVYCFSGDLSLDYFYNQLFSQ